MFFSCLIGKIADAQTDSIFEKISKTVQDFKLDTSAAPNDKFTKKIIELDCCEVALILMKL